MSYDSDFENIYMVEFKSGRIIHVQFFDTNEVMDYCGDNYPKEVIKTIYEEVYSNDGEDE
jgi:hypothetical protein